MRPLPVPLPFPLPFGSWRGLGQKPTFSLSDKAAHVSQSASLLAVTSLPAGSSDPKVLPKPNQPPDRYVGNDYARPSPRHAFFSG